MHVTHHRIGLGFEFSEKKHGDPMIVGLVYAHFKNLVQSDRPEFERFVLGNHLEIEWHDGHVLQFVPTPNVVDWLLKLPTNPVWLFVGRLLWRGKDAVILDDPIVLGAVMQTVLCGFRPLWEKTQMMAKNG
jgi:hypothetical protein